MRTERKVMRWVLFAAVSHCTIPCLNRHIGNRIALDFGIDVFGFGSWLLKFEVGNSQLCFAIVPLGHLCLNVKLGVAMDK